jgi:hypothetical protein
VNDIYIILGSSGIIGSQVADHLVSLRRPFLIQSARRLAELDSPEFTDAVDQLVNEIYNCTPNTKTVALILCHRQRTQDIVESIRSELRICRDFVLSMSERIELLNVIVFGSITGARVDFQSSESYHYAKDLQKTCVRQSIKTPNVNMNLLELSWFEKYSHNVSDSHYKSKILELKKLNGIHELPTIADLSDYALRILDAQRPPRGSIIPYDSGYSVLQEVKINGIF